MKKWGINLGIIVVLGLFIQSCGLFQPSTKKWHPDGTFVIKTPSYLKANKKTSPGAVLQLRNLDKDIFFVLRATSLDSLKSKFSEEKLDDFYQLHQENISERLENPSSTGPDSLETPYLWGLTGNIKGNYNGNLLRHQLVLLEDSLNLYQILYWMPESLWEKHSPGLMEAVQSLQPLSPSNMP